MLRSHSKRLRFKIVFVDTAVSACRNRQGGIRFRGILDQVAARKIHPDVHNVVSGLIVLATNESRRECKQNHVGYLLIVHNVHKECLLGK